MNMNSLQLYAPGANVTGDLRLVGIVSILLKKLNHEGLILYHDGGKGLPAGY